MYYSTVQTGNVELTCPKTWDHCQVDGGLCRITSMLQWVSLDRAFNRNQETTMRSDTFESDILSLMREQDIPGVSLVTIRHGSMGKALALGVRDLSTNDPVDERTIFGAASLTKPVAAYATLQLVDAGELDLDAPLARFAGPVNPEDPASHSITTRHSEWLASNDRNRLWTVPPSCAKRRAPERKHISSVAGSCISRPLGDD